MNDGEHATCPACGGGTMGVFIEIERAAAVSNVLWSDRDAAVNSPRATIALGLCDECGMLYNVAYDPALVRYDQRYENALDHSPRFRAYADELARRLVRTHNLRRKDIVEIGCGQGGFLTMLAMLGDNRAVGYDPGHDGARASAETREAATIIPETFSKAHAGRPVDFLCCRHVLEHVHDPLGFLRDIRRSLDGRPEAVVYFEAPNGLQMLRDLFIWDMIYEHCSYFTPSSLSRLFLRAGFEPIAISEQYGGQFLGVEARPSVPTSDPAGAWANPPEFGAAVWRFQQAYNRKVDAWRTKLASLAEEGSRAVVWGAGSKGVSFMNALDVTEREVRYVVDLNPHKQGRFLTGTGHEIVAPEFLAEWKPRTVIVMNPIYMNEIRDALAGMSISAEMHAA